MAVRKGMAGKTARKGMAGKIKSKFGNSPRQRGMVEIAKARKLMEANRPRGLAKVRQEVSRAKAKAISKIDAGKSAIKTRLKDIGAKAKAVQASASTKLKSIGKSAAPSLRPARMPLGSMTRPAIGKGIARAGMASAARIPTPKR